jgi:hypothetical protein
MNIICRENSHNIYQPIYQTRAYWGSSKASLYSKNQTTMGIQHHYNLVIEIHRCIDTGSRALTPTGGRSEQAVAEGKQRAGF